MREKKRCLEFFGEPPVPSGAPTFPVPCASPSPALELWIDRRAIQKSSRVHYRPHESPCARGLRLGLRCGVLIQSAVGGRRRGGRGHRFNLWVRGLRHVLKVCEGAEIRSACGCRKEELSVDGCVVPEQSVSYSSERRGGRPRHGPCKHYLRSSRMRQGGDAHNTVRRFIRLEGYPDQ